MKYINVFADEAAYKDASLEKPQLAYVTDGGKVYSLSNNTQPVTTGYPIKYKVNNGTAYDFSVFEEMAKQTGCTDINHFMGIDKTEGPDSDGYYTAYFENPITFVGGLSDEITGNVLKLGPLFMGMGEEQPSPFTDVILPTTTISIEAAFFYGANLNSINIPNSVTNIGEVAFQGCTGLTSINIPNSVTSIGYAAFADCRMLTNISIPDSVISISDYAFQSCSSLINATIGSAVTSIGNHAFQNCAGLTNITSMNATPPTLGSNVFASVPENCSIYVPAASVDAYKAASGWSDRAAYIGNAN